MLDNIRRNDEQLSPNDIRQLENADELAHFFARLGYNVDTRINIPDPAALGLGTEDLRQHIHKIELLGEDPVDGDILIYVFEVRSVTAKLRNEIARRFRDRPENALLVLTTDYESLEFVMLQKSQERSRSKFQPLKLVIRPVPFTINRLNPGPVALRVLKRWTFTEDDAAYQWEKLRSAYMLAEWSEEYFNNRALFSDYYLNHRLTDPKLTPEWNSDADVRRVGRAVLEQMAQARTAYTGKAEQQIRAGLYSPLFKLLGFDAVEHKIGSSAAQEADYLLYAPGDQTKPLAAALCYVWNRSLDDVDLQRDPDTGDEIPGALVVSVLERGVAPWVIVTNGKLWRLYSATASNKATNYYEVDLEEAVAASDQVTALKYWWLLFRREAFTGFADMLLKQSAEYAKELGERLKDRVFVQIFPQFARGFIADMRAKGVTTFDDAALADVFSGTMTFLYRMMFILYAESLDLLPVGEEHGYRELSVRRLKHEIADAGGTLLDGAPDHIGKHYKTSSTALYDRLKALFAVIDRGSVDLNMPTYNGGLFSTTSPEGRFLESYAIGDRFLALGLDRLARDIDTRTQALVMIDFKSLGVRQLGSIYEGLLEFKLRIAAEKLAVTKEKGKEIYQPFAAAKKPITTLDKGDVYLENDKRERKATGSYYTPDYIVKYIVQHTVGPVLDRKFADLEGRLRSAHRDFRSYDNLVKARQKSTGKQESSAVFWNRSDMQQLVDECLNVRVLDPAMGSGHFLVEVVDYVSNRLISFLNGWSENPVWALLDQTRADILDEMDRQRVSIDADRLTRVALLKRAVLKRCVYGVDLNEMAVELAKVSLWLDAFTLGAPLSFLDHHLKWGNSLIGARIKDVQQYLDARTGETVDMFSGSKFAGVMLATDLMRQVSYLSDNTMEQSRQSAAQFQQASDHLAPYKRVLDVYTSRYFGNQPPKKVRTDYVRLFLRDPQTEAWLSNPATTLDDSLIPATQLAATTIRAAADKRFFHWELEFPEVFFAPATPGGQDVELVEGGGFDAVVGNPPYASVSGDAIRTFFDDSFSSPEYQYDLFVFFIESGLRLLKHDGLASKIVPSTFAVQHYYTKLRQYLLNNSRLDVVLHFKYPVFDDATVESAVYVISRSAALSEHTTKMAFVWSEQDIVNNNIQYGEAAQSLLYSMPGQDLNVFVAGKRANIFSRLLGNDNHKFDDVANITVGVKPYQTGKGKPKQTSDIVQNRVFDADFKKDDTYRKYLVGTDIHRYDTKSSERWISYGDWLAEPRYSAPFNDIAKILIRQTSDSIIATVDTEQHLTLNNIHNVEVITKLYSAK